MILTALVFHNHNAASADLGIELSVRVRGLCPAYLYRCFSTCASTTQTHACRLFIVASEKVLFSHVDKLGPGEGVMHNIFFGSFGRGEIVIVLSDGGSPTLGSENGLQFT